MPRPRRALPAIALPWWASALLFVTAIVVSGVRNARREAPAGLTLHDVQAGAPLPVDARAFLAAKVGEADVVPLVRASMDRGRQTSAVLAAEALARGVTDADLAPPLGLDGAAILTGRRPDEAVWSTAGRAGFAALMAARCGRQDLSTAIQSMVDAPPSDADKAAGLFALSRMGR